MTIQEGPIEWPDMERYSDTPMFNTKAVVQQTGVPAPTLRAWERRYGLLAPERENNNYRLYSERDIIMIHWLKERVDTGMAISHAVALFQHLSREASQSHIQAETPEMPPIEPEIQPDEVPQKIDGALKAQYPIRNWAELGHEPAQNLHIDTHNMHTAQSKLIESFDNLDESTANMLISSMLAVYPIEHVCTELITPTMWQVGQLWSEGHMNVPAEHFASNFFRALLTNLFHVATRTSTGPLILVCCAPGETHELAALMLALFLRRRSMHVIYLGQSIETPGLLKVIQRLSPTLVCVSLTMPTYLSALIDLGRKIDELPTTHPIFAFGGQAFCQFANLIPQIPGTYLEGDMISIVNQLQHLAQGRSESNN